MNSLSLQRKPLKSSDTITGEHIEGIEEYEERLKEELRVATALGDSAIDTDTSDMGSDRNNTIISESSGGREAGNENRE